MAKLEATVATRGPDVFQANDFFFYLGAAGSDVERAGILRKYASLADALDALGFSGHFPGELIGRFDGEANMNAFSGGHYDRTNLVEAVIERTRARQSLRRQTAPRQRTVHAVQRPSTAGAPPARPGRNRR